MRLGWALSAVVLAAAVGGCTSDDPSPSTWATPPASAPAGSAPAWTEPPSYAFVLTRGCDTAAPLGRYRVTVKDGAVTGAQRLDAAVSPSSSGDVDLGPVTGDAGEEIEVPTLGQLLEMAQTAADDGGEVTKTLDATDGHPVQVSINVEQKECFGVSEYAPAA